MLGHLHTKMKVSKSVIKKKLTRSPSAMPSEGIIMTVVLKRRILNELLTTYLPSLLILTIVYTTNFFKDFFFEAVVTVNLTSQLVLTTLFISVSGALPKTAYVKMIDIWLIFAQLIPFFEVSQATASLIILYISSLRCCFILSLMQCELLAKTVKEK